MAFNMGFSILVLFSIGSRLLRIIQNKPVVGGGLWILCLTNKNTKYVWDNSYTVLLSNFTQMNHDHFQFWFHNVFFYYRKFQLQFALSIFQPFDYGIEFEVIFVNESIQIEGWNAFTKKDIIAIFICGIIVYRKSV